MDSIPHPWERARRLGPGAPLDWTSSFERTVWALTLGDRIFDLYAEPLDVLRESRSPRYRGIAGRMAENLERLNRIFGMAGVGAIAGWREPIYFQPPWRDPVPPGLTDGELGGEGEPFAPWPPLEWESPADREQWYWRVDGLCEYLAGLALRAYPEAEQSEERSEERRCVEWAVSRLRSLLVKARRGWPWGEDPPRLRRAPALGFWIGWPGVGGERPGEKDGPAGMGERKR
jgi:hypothetical protein